MSDLDDERDPSRSTGARRIAWCLLRKRSEYGVEQIAGPTSVQRGDRPRLTESEPPQRRGFDFERGVVDLVRNEWTKVLKLLIDGNVVARKFCPFPGSVTLTATIDEGKRKYEVVVKSEIRFPFYHDTIEVDGRLLELTKTK